MVQGVWEETGKEKTFTFMQFYKKKVRSHPGVKRGVQSASAKHSLGQSLTQSY